MLLSWHNIVLHFLMYLFLNVQKVCCGKLLCLEERSWDCLEEFSTCCTAWLKSCIRSHAMRSRVCFRSHYLITGAHMSFLSCINVWDHLSKISNYTAIPLNCRYSALEDYENSIKLYRSALQVDERHYNAWYGLGVVYLRQEKFEFAEHHFRRAFQINPCSSVLMCYLGMALHALKVI